MKNRRLKIGAYSTVVSLIVIAIAIIVNLVVTAVPSAYTKIDTSGLGLYDLSEETEAIIKGVDEKVTLYLVAQDGMEDKTVFEFLSRYQLLNSNITVEVIDPAVTPSLTTANETHDLAAMTANSVLAVSEKRDYEVDYSAIYTTEYSEEEYYNYYYYGVTPTGTTTFCGEQAITGALDNVTSDKLPILYTLEGHGETALDSGLSGYIETDNYQVSTLTLMTGDGTIPADASCVIINAPTSDISANEIETLKSYVDGGGRLILITGYNTNGTTLTNLYALAAYYGMYAVEGIVMDETTSNFYQYPHYLIPNMSPSSNITASMNGSYVLMPVSEGFTVAEELREGLSVAKILTTSSSAYTCTVTDSSINNADKLYEGECVVGACATYTEGDTTGKFVWYSSTGITNDSIDSYVSGGNSTLFLSTLSDLCEKKDSVSIAGKVMATDTLVVSTAASNLWGTVFTVVLPLAIILIGFGVWYSRRKK